MSKRIAARNAIVNWMGMASHLLVGFVILPFLIRTLGQTTYGLWLIIGSLAGYINVVDFGIGGSVGRNVAYCHAKKDLEGVNGLVSTAVAYLVCVAVLALVVTLVTAHVFFGIVTDIPAEQHPAARLAIILVGTNLALTLPLNAFDGVLWAYQRFDLQNAIDIPVLILRAALTFLYVRADNALVALGTITISTGLLAGALKTFVAFWVEPGLRVSLARVAWPRAKTLFGYGVWYFLLSLTRNLGPQINLMLVGLRLSTRDVTPYSVARRVTGYANSFLIAGTQVLTPLATALHAKEERARQRRLFLEGGKYCLLLALYFLTLFVFLGPTLLRLWLHGELQGAYPLLVVLALGELLPMSQWITYSIILGKGRHKVMALASVVEIAVGVGLALLLGGPWGLMGVCVALALCAGLCRGVFQWLYACGLAEVSPPSYLIHAFVPSILAATGPALLLGLVASWRLPETWVELVAYAGVYSVVFFAVAGLALIGVWRLRLLFTHGAAREAGPSLGQDSYPKALLPSEERFAQTQE
jgi:O-antigen/teichoic acid export membrane protein